MKKVFSLLLSILMLLSVTAGVTFESNAEIVDSGVCGDGVNYYYSNGELTISPFGNGTHEMYDINDEHKCPYSSLKNSIKKIIITDGITRIGDKAFNECSLLNEVLMSNDIKSIGIGAFENCENLEEVFIPNGVISIESYAFAGCIGLRSITIPESVTIIEIHAFENCSNLNRVNINNLTAWCNITFDDYESNPLYYGNNLYTDGSIITNLIIPNSVTEIKNYAFCGCSMQSLKISSSVTDISSRAFNYCDNLYSIVVDSANKSFDSRNNCNAIVYTEGNRVISGCNNSTIPSTINAIDDYSFRGCSGLTSITIPKDVFNIKNNPFIDCNNLEKVTVSSDNEVYDSRDNCNAVIETNYNKIIIGCKNTIIPNSVTQLGEDAFAISSLESIVIPESIKLLTQEESAFYYCSGLKEVTILNPNCDIDDEPFGYRALTVYGYDYSTAETFASKRNNLTFISISEGDTRPPTGRITSTHYIESYQTVTLSLWDTKAVDGYYWGTSSDYYNNPYNYTAHEPRVIISKDITTDTTFYLTIKDTSNNISKTYSIAFAKIQLDANGGTVTPSTIIIKSKSSVELPIPTKDNYTFLGWSKDRYSQDGIIKISSADSATYFAIWQEKEHINHNYLLDSTVDATCKSEGIKTYKCSVCGDIYVETSPKVPHTEVIDKAVAATCENSGLTQGSHCSVCQETIIAQQVVKATGHNYNEKITRAATCTRSGLKTYTCTVCNESYTENIPIIDHDYKSEIIKEPTNTSTGLRTYTCTVCGDKYSEVLPIYSENSPERISTNESVYIPYSESGKDFTFIAEEDAVYSMNVTGGLVFTTISYKDKDGNISEISSNNGDISIRHYCKLQKGQEYNIHVGFITMEDGYHDEETYFNIEATDIINIELLSNGPYEHIDGTNVLRFNDGDKIKLYTSETDFYEYIYHENRHDFYCETEEGIWNFAYMYHTQPRLEYCNISNIGYAVFNLMGFRIIAEVTEVESPILYFTYEPVNTNVYYKINTNGHWEVDENGTSYYFYDYKHFYSAGDIITIYRTDGTVEKYKYNSDSCDFHNIDTKKRLSVMYPNDWVEANSNQLKTHWKPGLETNKIYINYYGKSAEVNVIIVPDQGWQKEGGVWRYYDNGSAVTGWQRISNVWYYFDSNGVMQTGWQKIGGSWYYFASGGAMQTGWQKIGNTWYYFKSGGQMVTGWQKIGSVWYYFKSGGAMVTGWQKIGSTWYYFKSGGAMVTGWQKISNKWYYFESSGAMRTANLRYKGKTYRFNSSGACLNP